MSILPAISNPPDNLAYRKVDLNLVSRNEFPVVNPHLATDGDDSTFADSAYWGAYQGLIEVFDTPLRIGAARLLADVFNGPPTGHCTMRFGNQSLVVNIGEGVAERVWTGDVMVPLVDVEEYARTNIHEVELWELVPIEKPAPAIVLPPLTPVEQAKVQSVERVGLGVAQVSSAHAEIASAGNMLAAHTLTYQSLAYWQDIAETDPENVNNLGTVGYLAASAYDFWQQIADNFTAGVHPNVILDQLNTWRDYSTAQAGKTFEQMTPVDVWFEAQN